MHLSARVLATFVISTSFARGFVQSAPAAPLAPPAQAAPKAEAAPAPDVYDEKADASAELARALVRAKHENRRVLIQWGANWCGWCRMLHGTMTKDAELSRKLMYEYDVVRVDVGRFDKNLELAKSLGAEIKAIPFLTIVGADGKAIVNQPTEPFEVNEGDHHGHDAKKLVAFLTEHQAPYLSAADLRRDALAAAKASGKRVFLHYGAPWCGWCHRLEGWMAQPEVAALLAKDFVDLKLDTDRTLGGGDLLKADRATAGVGDGGIPWIEFLDGDGKQLATGDRKGKDGKLENIGFPYQDAEIDHFLGMIDAVRVHITPEDVAALRASLQAIRAADEKRKAERAAH